MHRLTDDTPDRGTHVCQSKSLSGLTRLTVGRRVGPAACVLFADLDNGTSSIHSTVRHACCRRAGGGRKQCCECDSEMDEDEVLTACPGLHHAEARGTQLSTGRGRRTRRAFKQHASGQEQQGKSSPGLPCTVHSDTDLTYYTPAGAGNEIYSQHGSYSHAQIDRHTTTPK